MLSRHVEVSTFRLTSQLKIVLLAAIAFVGLTVFSGSLGTVRHDEAAAQPATTEAPAPLLEKGHPVDWWFVFKFNTQSFPSCGDNAERKCPFGGKVQNYKAFGQQFVYASSENPSLQQGNGCAGGTTTDPLGATFDQVYHHSFYYVLWNDQFYDDPKINGCTQACGAPWGHSKGMLAWNATGEGVALQVTTPSWPAAGSADSPRHISGNTLGCIARPNNVLVSQHFFSVKLNKDDLLKVLKALQNASVVTDPTNRQLVHNGGPADVQQLVESLGTKSRSTTVTKETLSNGVELISKPSRLNVPPWQMVSAVLGGVPLRTATWWAAPKIYTTTKSTKVACWNTELEKPGPVEIAITGHWAGTTFGLSGGPGKDFNHAKIGVSTGDDHYAIFGDLNQQGILRGQNCSRSQNGRGGLFYVLGNNVLFDSVTNLIHGATAPTKALQ